MNVHMTKEQLAEIIATLEWSAKMLEEDARVLGMPMDLREFAVNRAVLNMDLAKMLEEQR